MINPIQVAFLIVALIAFGCGMLPRYWAAPTLYHPLFISAGLFFATLAFVWSALVHSGG
jgi:hypothetical protein